MQRLFVTLVLVLCACLTPLALSMQKKSSQRNCVVSEERSKQAAAVEYVQRRFITPTGFVVHLYKSYFSIGHISNVSSFQDIRIPGLHRLSFVEILRDSERCENALTLVVVGRTNFEDPRFAFRLYNFVASSTALALGTRLVNRSFLGVTDFTLMIRSAFILPNRIFVLSGAFTDFDDTFPFVLKFIGKEIVSTMRLHVSKYEDLGVHGFDLSSSIVTPFNQVIQEFKKVSEAYIEGLSLLFDLETMKATVLRPKTASSSSQMLSSLPSGNIFEVVGSRVSRISSKKDLFNNWSDSVDSIDVGLSVRPLFYHVSSRTLFLHADKRLVTCMFQDNEDGYIVVKEFPNDNAIYRKDCLLFYFPKLEQMAFLPVGEGWPQSIERVPVDEKFIRDLDDFADKVIQNIAATSTPTIGPWNVSLRKLTKFWHKYLVMCHMAGGCYLQVNACLFLGH